MFLWVFALWDIFSRHDLSGWVKALWAIAIVLVPLFGMLVYFIARPKDLMTGYGGYGGYAYADPYGYSPTGYRPEYERASGPRPGTTDMEVISRMHESGTLSDDEFNDLQQRMLSTTPPNIPGAEQRGTA